MADRHSSHVNPSVRHETTDIDLRAVLAFGVGLLATGILVYFAVWVLFQFFAGREARHAPPEFPLAVGREAQLPPEPRLQTNPRQDLRNLRAQEDAVLQSYGWVDKNAGVVRIPISEAMKLTVERGLPVRQAGGASK